MKQFVVRYRTHADRAEENQRLVEKVFSELTERDPGGVRYATFRLADGVSFVHIALLESDDGANPLGEIGAFAEFQRALKERCYEPPASQEASVVGSYRFFAG